MWSNERPNRVFNNRMVELTCRFRFTEMGLGTQPGNPDIYREFIASKAPNAKTMEEEIAQSGIDEVAEKKITVFPMGKFFQTPDNQFFDTLNPRSLGNVKLNGDGIPLNPDGTPMSGEFVIVPFIWDYQWKGAFKEGIQMLSRIGKKKGAKKSAAKEETPATNTGEEKPKPKRGRPKKVVDSTEAEVEASNDFAAAKITAFKKVVDGNWFVKQRRIPLLVPDTWVDDLGDEHPSWVLDSNGKRTLNTFSRSLRADTMQGPRVTLASSQFVPAGTEFYCTFQLLNPADKEALLEILDYKMRFGMLQWRSGGKGTVIWTPADEHGRPIDD